MSSEYSLKPCFAKSFNFLRILFSEKINSDKLFKMRNSTVNFLETETPSKKTKNAFYVTLKALSVLQIFKFLYKNGLIKKTRLTWKFLTSQPAKQTIPIHMFPSISRSKGNQRTKFGQLIENNMRNIFLKN